jgi:hypothetical protein
VTLLISLLCSSKYTTNLVGGFYTRPTENCFPGHLSSIHPSFMAGWWVNLGYTQTRQCAKETKKREYECCWSRWEGRKDGCRPGVAAQSRRHPKWGPQWIRKLIIIYVQETQQRKKERERERERFLSDGW